MFLLFQILLAWGGKTSGVSHLGKTKVDDFLGKTGQGAGASLLILVREHLDPDGDDAALDKAEFLGGSDGDVDDPTFFVGAAIVDGHDFGFVVGEVDHAHLGAHGKGFVGGGGGVVAEFLPAGGFGAAIGFDRIPGGFAFFRRFYDVGISGILDAAGATGDEDETCESHHRGLFGVPCV